VGSPPRGCSVYTAPFTISAQGRTYVYYWSQDKAGNVSFTSSEPYQWVSIDETAPSTTAALAGTKSSDSGWYVGPVSVTLSATDPGTSPSGVQTTYYAIDTPACTPAATATCHTYSGAVSVTAGGAHTFTYTEQ
jgi:hypothetical protein